MALVTKREMRQLLHMHYIFEIFLAFAYVIVKVIDTRTFDGEWTTTETELYLFVVIIIAFTTRRRGHVNFLPYLSSACSMAKVGNLILFMFKSYKYLVTYMAICLVHVIFFPKPRYKGPDNVTYFIRDEFEKQLSKDKNVKWLIEFFVTWNPDCTEFASVFKELSAKYATDKFRFGKIDVERSPKIAEKYGVVQAVTSKTLPALILFENGREVMRRPLTDSRSRIVPFSFSYENVASVFNLDSI